MDNETLLELDRKKRFLKRYKKNIALIVRLKDKIEDLNKRMYTLRSPKLSGMPRGGDPITIEDLTAEKVDLENRIKRLESKGKRYKSEILDKIDDLDDPRYAEILESFFIDCKDFDTIAEETGYNVRHVIRLYSEAVQLVPYECHEDSSKMSVTQQYNVEE